MFPFVPKAVPSPLAGREFCARRRPSMFLWPTAISLPTMAGALLTLPIGNANLGGPAARAELIARKRAWKLFMGTNGNNIARH